jgi:gag-polypeptide of LTR copia-type
MNQIKSLGENLGDKAVCEKILISLSLKYNNIAAIIEETKDLSTLSVHDLMGSLEMHEQRMSRNDEQSFETTFQTKMNVKESSNQNMNNKNASHGGHGGSRGRDNFARRGGRSNNHGGGCNNQCGEVKIYH